MTFNNLHKEISAPRWLANCGINRFELQLKAQSYLDSTPKADIPRWLRQVLNDAAAGEFRTISDAKSVLMIVDYGAYLDARKSVYW